MGYKYEKKPPARVISPASENDNFNKHHSKEDKLPPNLEICCTANLAPLTSTSGYNLTKAKRAFLKTLYFS